jgi:septum formation protein
MQVPPLPPGKFDYELLLGSASPRRRELLSSLGFKFTLVSLDVKEEWPVDLRGKDIAMYLAKLKAGGFTGKLSGTQVLITADTIVWCQDKIYNKPADFDEGKRMLRSLSGKMHQVFTGVCLTSSDRQVTFYDESKVYFKQLSDEEIEFYLNNFKPYDKAGAYGVQDWLGYIGIDRIDGSFYNVMGLPVKLLYEQLLNFSK